MGLMRPTKARHKAVKATAMATEVDLDMGDGLADQPSPESKHSATLSARERGPVQRPRLARATHRLSPRSIAEPLTPSPEHALPPQQPISCPSASPRARHPPAAPAVLMRARLRASQGRVRRSL